MVCFCRCFEVLQCPCHTSLLSRTIEPNLSPYHCSRIAIQTNVYSTKKTDSSRSVLSPGCMVSGWWCSIQSFTRDQRVSGDCHEESLCPCSTFLWFWITLLKFFNVSQYLSAFIIVPASKKSMNSIPFQSENIIAMTLTCKLCVFNFHSLDKEGFCHSHDHCFVSGVKWNAHVSLPMTIESKKLPFSSA